MTFRRPLGIALAAALCAAGAVPASATPVLDRDVAGSAGGVLAGGGFILGMTVGEGVVGLALAPSLPWAEVAGFWGPGSVAVLAVGDPAARPGRIPGSLGILPNPSVSATRLEWALPAGVRALGGRAEIFDTRGRRVRALEPAPSAGSATVVSFDWDGRDDRGVDAGPGIYFCRLVAGEAVMTGRLALIR